MKKIGIVYAISQSAGELCKKHILENSSSDVEIITHESLSSKYKAAANDLQKISSLLITSIDYLQKNGSETIIIAANSVHRAFDFVNQYVKEQYPYIQLISIVDTVVSEVFRKNYRNVAIFGSTSTINSSMYQNKLQKEEINVIPLTNDEQELINSLISAGIFEKIITREDKQQMITIANRLKQLRCDAIIFACTELPLIFNSDNLNIYVLDTNLLLALTAIRR